MREIVLSESELKKLIYKIINEVRIGYDSPEVMRLHSYIFVQLMEALNLLSGELEEVMDKIMTIESTSYDEELDQITFFFRSVIEDFATTYNKLKPEIPEDEIIKKGERLLGGLYRFQEAFLSTFQTFGMEFYGSVDNFKEHFASKIFSTILYIKDFGDTVEKYHEIYLGKSKGGHSNSPN